MPKASISSRAERLWQRLSEWYGSRITDQYGKTPPADWCAVVDRSDNDAVKRALSIIRQHYLEHPPTLPQFEKAFAPPLIGRVEAGPTIQERLCEFVMATHGRKLTQRQIRVPWDYRYKRVRWVDNIGRNRDEFAECVGVDVPAGGAEHPGLRVTVEDLERWHDSMEPLESARVNSP